MSISFTVHCATVHHQVHSVNYCSNLLIQWLCSVLELMRSCLEANLILSLGSSILSEKTFLVMMFYAVYMTSSIKLWLLCNVCLLHRPLCPHSRTSDRKALAFYPSLLGQFTCPINFAPQFKAWASCLQIWEARADGTREWVSLASRSSGRGRKGSCQETQEDSPGPEKEEKGQARIHDRRSCT